MPERWLVLVAVLLAGGLFGYRMAIYIRAIRKGRSLHRMDHPIRRFLWASGQVLVQIPTVKDRPLVGLFHAFLFFGFLAFVLASVDHFSLVLGEPSLLRVWGIAGPYLRFVDVFAGLVLVGVLGLGIRRLLIRPEALHVPREERGTLVNSESRSHPQRESVFILLLIAAVMVTYLLFRVESEGPVGRVGWWSHFLVILGFLVYIPYSKHLHLLLAPVNLFFRRHESSGSLEALDLEGEEEWGASRLEHLPWKRLLDGLACIECGRCDSVCPAYYTGKPLSPKWMVVNLKHRLYHDAAKMARGGVSGGSLLETVINSDSVWGCTACGACMEACPFDIEHIPTIMDIRREQVLMHGQFPTEVTQAFKGLETNANPWGQAQSARADWTEGLDVPPFGGRDGEILFWVGCALSYDARAQSIARAMVRSLREAGVLFGILGTEERCTGDPARRLGHEYLFQTLAEANIEAMKARGVREVVTTCPHCFHTIKNEYPAFDGKFQVYHHSEFLTGLLEGGRLRARRGMEGRRITFHDPCFLGRHNGIYDPPRKVESYTGATLVEMHRCRSKGFCCGAGGGLMWVEDRPPRINEERSREVLATDPHIVSTACPFCTTMLTDGIKSLGSQVPVKDIVEILQESAEGQGS